MMFSLVTTSVQISDIFVTFSDCNSFSVQELFLSKEDFFLMYNSEKNLNLDLIKKDFQIKNLNLDLKKKDFRLEELINIDIESYLKNTEIIKEFKSKGLDKFFLNLSINDRDSFFFLKNLCLIVDKIFLSGLDIIFDKDKVNFYNSSIFNFFFEDPLNRTFKKMENISFLLTRLNFFRYIHLCYFKGIFFNNGDEILQVIFQSDFFCNLQSKSQLDIISDIYWNPNGSFFLNLFKNFPDEINQILIEENSENAAKLLKEFEKYYYFKVLNYDSQNLSLAKLKLSRYDEDNLWLGGNSIISQIDIEYVNVMEDIFNNKTSLFDLTLDIKKKYVYMLNLSDYSAFIKQDFSSDVFFNFYDCLEKIKKDAITFEYKLIQNNMNLSTDIFRIDKLSQKETFLEYLNRIIKISNFNEFEKYKIKS